MSTNRKGIGEPVETLPNGSVFTGGNRKNEEAAWKAAHSAFVKDIGTLTMPPNIAITMTATLLKAYAVDAIMDFQELMGNEGEGQ